METDLLLSIIIPVYKVEKYIKRCLDSIYNQRVEEHCFETIVVNDGSPDKSGAIVRQFVAEHINCRLINQENQGLSVARNNGFKEAKGEFVWFVDSDDWLAENALDVILDYIKKQRYDVYATCLRYAHDNPAKDFVEKTIKHDCVITPYDYILNHCIGASQRFIIRRSFMIKNNIQFYPGILHEDGEFGPRLISAAKTILLIHDTVYMYYQRGEGSIMSSWTIRNTKDSLVVFRRDIELAESVTHKMLRNAILYEALKVLLFAFPKGGNEIEEVRTLYKEYQQKARIIATRILLSDIPHKKKIMPLLALISIKLANSFKEYRNNRLIYKQRKSHYE